MQMFRDPCGGCNVFLLKSVLRSCLVQICVSVGAFFCMAGDVRLDEIIHYVLSGGGGYSSAVDESHSVVVKEGFILKTC